MVNSAPNLQENDFFSWLYSVFDDFFFFAGRIVCSNIQAKNNYDKVGSFKYVHLIISHSHAVYHRNKRTSRDETQ